MTPVANISRATPVSTMPRRSLSDILHLGTASTKTRRYGGSGHSESDNHTRSRALHVPKRGFSGPRFVLVLYAGLVAVAGAAGFLTATFVDSLEPPAYLFLVEFPATQVGFAAYGALTIATVLGIPLLFVVYVSQYIDDPDAVSPKD